MKRGGCHGSHKMRKNVDLHFQCLTVSVTLMYPFAGAALILPKMYRNTQSSNIFIRCILWNWFSPAVGTVIGDFDQCFLKEAMFGRYAIIFQSFQSAVGTVIGDLDQCFLKEAMFGRQTTIFQSFPSAVGTVIGDLDQCFLKEAMFGR